MMISSSRFPPSGPAPPSASNLQAVLAGTYAPNLSQMWSPMVAMGHSLLPGSGPVNIPLNPVPPPLYPYSNPTTVEPSDPRLSHSEDKPGEDVIAQQHERSLNEGSVNYMFLAKVLVGSYTLGRQNYRKPPPLYPGQPYGRTYDSCVNDESNPEIYVVFDTAQCYPEYVIEYTNLPCLPS